MSTSSRRHWLLILVGLILCLVAGTALANGDGDGPPIPTCPKGKVWDSSIRRCVLKTSQLLQDADRAAYAYHLTRLDRSQEALDLLDTLQQPDTPQALNYRGYATRKLGRVDEGIGYYLKAVQLDPQYVLVREYLGEAYVLKGRLDLAREQLQMIERLCGRDCESYEDLSASIAHPEAL
ncbi:M48 family metallopeptidase [Pseudomonas sp. R5(2019)]|uniref:tetratricopeptide repeat protein n=1 Tax=Pseudomonas sp. R5(2019) TaxID=2697566 RepID=UPI0014133C49|nr:tetratricopeptide repeat protein [Pseudomonas sp. R5(2019)]NBA96340.1 tetratricopeptide repeat protein [Pseudomonas sp. R5(2019)]